MYQFLGDDMAEKPYTVARYVPIYSTGAY